MERGIAVLIQGETGTGKEVLARALGICRPSLYRVLRRLDIAPLKSQLALGSYAPS
ncbi:hypothetical protein D3C80_2131140 [compost metagenome]